MVQGSAAGPHWTRIMQIELFTLNYLNNNEIFDGRDYWKNPFSK